MGPYARACRVECRGAAPRIVFPSRVVGEFPRLFRIVPGSVWLERARFPRLGGSTRARRGGWDDERVARGDGGDVAHGGEDRAAARGEVVGGERGVEDAIGDRVRRGGPVGGYLCVVLDVRQGPGWRGCVGVDGRGDGHEAELDDDAVSAEGSELPLERGSSRRRVVGSGGVSSASRVRRPARTRARMRASSPRDGAGKDAGGDPRATRRRTRRPACGPEEARIARSRLVGSRSRRSTARVRSPPTDPRVGVSSVTSTVARADRATWRRRTRGTSCSATRRPPRSRNATRISNPTRAPTARRVARRATRALASRQRSVPEKTHVPRQRPFRLPRDARICNCNILDRCSVRHNLPTPSRPTVPGRAPRPPPHTRSPPGRARARTPTFHPRRRPPLATAANARSTVAAVSSESLPRSTYPRAVPACAHVSPARVNADDNAETAHPTDTSSTLPDGTATCAQQNRPGRCSDSHREPRARFVRAPQPPSRPRPRSHPSPSLSPKRRLGPARERRARRGRGGWVVPPPARPWGAAGRARG